MKRNCKRSCAVASTLLHIFLFFVYVCLLTELFLRDYSSLTKYIIMQFSPDKTDFGSEELKIHLKKLSACAKPPYLILPSGIPSPYSIPPHACPPPIPSHPMHALPLFYPTPCMPAPYSIPLHVCPPPILSHSMHALPPLYPTHVHPPPILSLFMHALPLFLPSPCMTSSIRWKSSHMTFSTFSKMAAAVSILYGRFTFL